MLSAFWLFLNLSENSCNSLYDSRSSRSWAFAVKSVERGGIEVAFAIPTRGTCCMQNLSSRHHSLPLNSLLLSPIPSFGNSSGSPSNDTLFVPIPWSTNNRDSSTCTCHQPGYKWKSINLAILKFNSQTPIADVRLVLATLHKYIRNFDGTSYCRWLQLSRKIARKWSCSLDLVPLSNEQNLYWIVAYSRLTLPHIHPNLADECNSIYSSRSLSSKHFWNHHGGWDALEVLFILKIKSCRVNCTQVNSTEKHAESDLIRIRNSLVWWLMIAALGFGADFFSPFRSKSPHVPEAKFQIAVCSLGGIWQMQISIDRKFKWLL